MCFLRGIISFTIASCVNRMHFNIQTSVLWICRLLMWIQCHHYPWHILLLVSFSISIKFYLKQQWKLICLFVCVCIYIYPSLVRKFQHTSKEKKNICRHFMCTHKDDECRRQLWLLKNWTELMGTRVYFMLSKFRGRTCQAEGPLNMKIISL